MSVLEAPPKAGEVRPLPTMARSNPEPTTRTRGGLGWLVAVGAAAATLGAGVGYVAFDDSDQVQDLRSQQADLTEQQATLEEEISGLEKNLAGLVTVEDQLAGLKSSVSELMAWGNEMTAAYEAYLATPLGSDAEIEAVAELDRLERQLVGILRAVEADLDRLESEV